MDSFWSFRSLGRDSLEGLLGAGSLLKLGDFELICYGVEELVDENRVLSLYLAERRTREIYF